jgi:hypothetical protein
VGYQLVVRFLVVELITQIQILDLTWILYLRLIILSVGGDVIIDSKALLVTDFINLKIKSAQSFKYAHRDKMYIYIFIGVNDHTCIISNVELPQSVLLSIIGDSGNPSVHYRFFGLWSLQIAMAAAANKATAEKNAAQPSRSIRIQKRLD